MDIKGLIQTGKTLEIDLPSRMFRIPPLDMFQCKRLRGFVDRVIRHCECRNAEVRVRIDRSFKVLISEEGTLPWRDLCCPSNKQLSQYYRVEGEYTRHGVTGREVHKRLNHEQFAFLKQTLEDCQTLGRFGVVVYQEDCMLLEIAERVLLCKGLTWDWSQEGVSEHDLIALCSV